MTDAPQLPDFNTLLLAQATEQTAIREQLPPVCDEHGCRDAYSHRDTCRCRCDGAGHGIAWRDQAAQGRAQMSARITRAGGVFATLPAAPADDEW